MPRKRLIEEIYTKHKPQIDTISALMGTDAKAAKVVDWLYGGSWESWRKFFAKSKAKKGIPKEVREFLSKLGGREE
jgi:hypothetical protein